MTNPSGATAALATLCMLTACASAPSAGGPPVAAQATRTCPTQTGTRIPVSPPDCSAAGRSYSNDDINRTGAATAGGALRLLDPALTVTH